MKVLPNTSSSFGTSSFGVMVSVTDNFEGSRSGNDGVVSTSAGVAKDLRHCVTVVFLDAVSRSRRDDPVEDESGVASCLKEAAL